MANDVDTRIDKLLRESEAIRQLNDGDGEDHPTFVAWRKRAETAVAEKLGRESDEVKELRQLTFFFSPIVWTESTVIPASAHQRSFERALNTAVGILTAARESSPVVRESGTPAIHIEHIGATSNAEAQANVHVQITTDGLRQLLASAAELTPEERGAAVAAIPDDGEPLDLEKADRLLSIATKSKEIFGSVLGWLLSDPNRWPFQP